MQLESYIQQTTRIMQISAWVLKTKQKNKGEILIHIKSRFQIINTAAKQAMR